MRRQFDTSMRYWAMFRPPTAAVSSAMDSSQRFLKPDGYECSLNGVARRIRDDARVQSATQKRSERHFAHEL
jgi:hypothetical protein